MMMMRPPSSASRTERAAGHAASSTRSRAGQLPAAGLHLHIDHISLYGFSHADAARFRQSLETSLRNIANAYRDHDWSAIKTVRIRQLDAGQLPAGASPEVAAERIAAQLFRQLTRHSGGAGHV
jgi:hypothetical protein